MCREPAWEPLRSPRVVCLPGGPCAQGAPVTGREWAGAVSTAPLPESLLARGQLGPSGCPSGMVWYRPWEERWAKGEPQRRGQNPENPRRDTDKPPQKIWVRPDHARHEKWVKTFANRPLKWSPEISRSCLLHPPAHSRQLYLLLLTAASLRVL